MHTVAPVALAGLLAASLTLSARVAHADDISGLITTTRRTFSTPPMPGGTTPRQG